MDRISPMAQKPIRMQFEISPALAKEIEDLEAEAEIVSHREYFANLVALWRWAAKRSREGKAICALDIETLKYNELTLPALDLVKMKALADRELSFVDREGQSESGNLTAQPQPA